MKSRTGFPHARGFTPWRVRPLWVAALIFCLAAAAAVPTVHAQTSQAAASHPSRAAWVELSGNAPLVSASGAERAVRATRVRASTLDMSVVRGALGNAPMELTPAARQNPAVLVLPHPDGSFQRFAMVESPVMEAGLAARHPHIKTYSGRGLDDTGATLRVSITQLGLQASVRSPKGAWYVEPLYRNEQAVYASYLRADVPRLSTPLLEGLLNEAQLSLERGSYRAAEQVRLNGVGFVPGSLVSVTVRAAGDVAPRQVMQVTASENGTISLSLTADPDHTQGAHVLAASDGRSTAEVQYRVVADGTSTDASTGPQLRIYRLGLLSDPGYANYFGGAANTTAAKVQMINRVTQVYEDETAIRLVLIANNDALNLDTAAQFSGANGPCGGTACFPTASVSCTGTVLSRNRLVLGMLVGASSFDIGHIGVGAGGGGVASLGSVGGNSKAQGCTGLPTPVGDVFAIDYVAHEMGHQFAGNHTFNGNVGSCSGGNRSAANSVEPGSGSSIMAYAGICGTDNTQPHSDPYWSQRSFDEITTFVNSAESNINEVQYAAIRNFNTDGQQFALRYNGVDSAAIVRGTNFTAAAIKAAIEAIPGWPAGGTVTISTLGDTAFTITYGGTLVGTNVNNLEFVGCTAPCTGFVGEVAKGGLTTRGGSTLTATGNAAPAIASLPPAYTIPVRTPFALTGSASDVDGDALTYMWEQNDRGASAGSALTNNAKVDGPLFRQFGVRADVSEPGSIIYNSPGQNMAGTDPTRVFPDMVQILANETNAETGTCAALAGITQLNCFSEFLPTAAYLGFGANALPARLNFKFTARDGNGGVNSGTTTLTLEPTAGPFLVTAPNTAVTWDASLPQTVTWDVANTNAAPVSTATVRISLSLDGGASFPLVLASGEPNDGSATLPLVGATPTTQARIKVEAENNVYFDISNTNFTITGTGPVLGDVTVVESGGTTNVTEGGATDTYTLALTAAPTGDVTITPSPDAQLSVAPATLTFTTANWATPQTVTVTAVDDAVAEGAHSGSISHSASGGGYSGVAIASVTTNISDNDSAGITVTESGGTTAVTEGGASDSYSYSVVLNSQPSANVGINIVFDPAQVILNGDTDGLLSLQFTPTNWDVVQTVTVSAVDDTLVEANPHSSSIVQTVSIGDPVYALINPADVTVSIADNDIQQISFDSAGSSVGEAAGTHVVNARLSINSNGTPGGTISADMTANVLLVLGSAEAADLGLATTSLTFPAGSAHNSILPIDLTVINDRLLEGNETATLNLALVSSVGSVSGTHVVTVIDDEFGSISFTAPSSATSESAGTHSGAIGRLSIDGTGTGPLASEASVSVAITDAAGSATTPADYTLATGTLVFAANAPSPVELPIPVGIANDALIENVESFSLGFGAISGAGVISAAGTHAVNIADNDLAQVGFAPGNDSVGEGAGSFGKPVVLTLTADGAGTPSLQSALVVPIGFAEGTALEPEDFTLATASVSFAAGSLNGASQNASASLVDDAVSEAVETFELTLGNGFVTPNITLGRAATTVSIVDNDTPGITVVQSGGSTVVAEGGASDNFTVVLTSQPTSDVTLALAGSQVTATASPLAFTGANWNIAQTVTVTAIDDAIDESSPHSGSVSFVVSSGDAAYNGFPVSAVSVQVDDNDTAGVSVSESGGDTAVTEGGADDTYTVVLTSEPTANVTVVLSTTAQLGLAPSGLTFNPANWNVAQTVTVSATDDGVVEGAHSAAIMQSTSSSDLNYSGIAVATVNVEISDNDSAVVGFDPVIVSRAEGSSPMAFTVTLSNPVASGVTLNLNTAVGTALAADFTPIVNGTVSFPASSTTPQSVNVVIISDALDEDDETFTLTLSGLTAVGSVSLGANVATGTIVDDDLPPVISISSPSQLEGDAGLTPMDFVVSLSAISGRNVTFTRATADGAATVGNNDYQALAPLQITIPAGQLSNTQTVQIVGDTVFEGDESFDLDLTDIVNATVALPPTVEGAPVGLTGTGTIEDDDQQPTTTTIISDDPDPSVVGQPYTVVVDVAAVSTSPLGTISISDGTDSCGPVALTTGTAPNSTASCALTSTTAGSRTLVATYTAASTAFAHSVSVGEAHLVNAAATTISVVGPTRSRINQPTTFSFALSVNAPGAGTPAGTVTLSSAASTCSVTLPTATPSCALTFDALGPRTINAAFMPADGNFLGSSSSGPQSAQTLVFALSDIAVTKSDGLGTFRPGDLVVYTVTVRNLGDDAATQIRVIDNVPSGLVDVLWTCDASGGVACPQAGGSGNLDVTIASFPVGGLLNFIFYGNVDGSPAQLVNTALVQLPADTTIEDPVPGNNSASDTNLLELLFANGFEAAAVNAPAGSVRLSGAALRGSLDQVAVVVYALDDANGEALRVYARVIGDEVRYALALRNAQGRLRLGAWASYAGDPLLTWTARPVADGWVLDSAALR
jgi:uncharacterized repeat protein (TIGR01451 family)